MAPKLTDLNLREGVLFQGKGRSPPFLKELKSEVGVVQTPQAASCTQRTKPMPRADEWTVKIFCP